MRNFLRLLEYARRHKRAWALITVLTVVSAGLAALQPWPMKLLVDTLEQVLKQQAIPANFGNALEYFFLPPTLGTVLAVAIIGTLLLFLLHSAVEAGLTWAWTLAGRRMVYDLAEDLFFRLQRRSIVFHKRNSVADLMSRVTVDSWSVYRVADALLFSPAHAVLTIVVMVGLMLPLDWRLTLVTLFLAPLMVGASFLLGKRLRGAAKQKRDIENRLQAHVQQTLTGIPVVQAFAQEDAGNLRFRSLADAAIRSQQWGAFLGSINSLSSGLVVSAGSGLVLWLGARHVLEGSLKLGSLFVFLGYLSSLQAQVKVLAGLYAALQGLSAGVNRTIEVLASPGEIQEKPGAAPLQQIHGDIRFEHVTAGYETGRPILKGVSLEAKAGETIAIVGATGAGKSTLVSLVPRFMDPWEGRILLDGKDLRDLKLKSLRQQIGIVLQDSFLFPVSVRENIAYGVPEASEEQIEAAARAANAHEFIVDLPGAYDAVIGERGATLSGGQRQRLAIARALLKNPPILILDEPTSALDAQTEKLILEALGHLMQGRTTFVIAHRLSTIRGADRILVLQDGRISESGAHEELLSRSGIYARLHRLQTQSPEEHMTASI